MVSLTIINDNLPAEKQARTPQRSQLPALGLATTPVAGQSLRGLAAHSLRCNQVRTSWRVLKKVGSPSRNRPLLSEHPSVCAEKLAAALRVDEETVQQRMYPVIGHSERSFFGLPVPHSGIENRERCFAPTFLKDNHHHLAAWELRLLPFCPASWDILISRCPCLPGKITTQGWTRTGSYPDQCDECSRPLNRLQTPQVPKKMRKDLQLAASLVLDVTHNRDGWRELLPQNLEGVETAKLFRVLHSLAGNISPSIKKTEIFGGKSEIGIDPATCVIIERLRLACMVIMGWPYAIEKARFNLAEDSAALVKLQKEYCDLGVIRDRPNRRAEETKTEPIPMTAEGARRIGIRKAAAFAQLTPETLQSIWDAGLVSRFVRPHGGKVLPAFEMKELKNIANSWRRRLELGSVAYRLGITRYGLEQIILEGGIIAKAITVNDDEPAFLDKDVADFEAVLIKLANPSITNGQSISDAFRKISGREKPWGPLITAMLAGRVRYNVLQGSCPIMDRVIIMLDSDSMISNLPDDANYLTDKLCQSDALEVLNCSASSLTIFAGLDSIGRNPRIFSRKAILKLAVSVIATTEVAEKLGIHPARVARIMGSAGIHEKVRGGWPRELTERFIGRVHQLQDAQFLLPFDSHN